MKFESTRNSYTFAVQQITTEEQKLKASNLSDDNVGKPGKVRNFEGFTSETSLSCENAIKMFHSLHKDLMYDKNMTENKAVGVSAVGISVHQL